MHGCSRLAVTAAFALAIVGCCLGVRPAAAQTLNSAFAANYHATSLGTVPGVPTKIGAVGFAPGDNNTLLIGGAAILSNGGIYSIGVNRDANGHITGFNGTGRLLANAPYIDGGLVPAPNGTLLFTEYGPNALGEILTGQNNPATTFNLTPLGISPSVGSLVFVPTGFPGAGRLKILSADAGILYDTTLSANSDGTYTVAAPTASVNLNSETANTDTDDTNGTDNDADDVNGFHGVYPEGAAYVAAGSPGFTTASLLITESDTGQVLIYQVDNNGNPIPSTQQVFLTNLPNAEGLVIDPVTGDLLITTFGSGDQLIVVTGFRSALAAPTNVTATASAGQVTVSWNASAGANSYDVLRSTSASGPFTNLTPSGVNSTSYVDTTVSPGTTYYYEVVALNGSAQSAPSTPVQVTVAATSFHWFGQDITVDWSDNRTRLLWDNFNGANTLWSIDNNGNPAAGPLYGPYAGYTSTAVASGPNGSIWELWTNSNGAADVWLVTPSNTYQASFVFGPYAGWTAKDIAVGWDNLPRILWTNANGAIDVWTVDTNGGVAQSRVFGPFNNWSGKAIAAGRDGFTRVLWQNTNGAAGVWVLGSDNSYLSSSYFGPYTGWSAIDIAVGADNQARVLWSNVSGAAEIWSVDNSGNTSASTIFGPYNNFRALRIAAGPDGNTRVLWSRSDGYQLIWLLSPNNTYINSFGFGPY